MWKYLTISFQCQELRECEQGAECFCPDGGLLLVQHTGLLSAGADHNTACPECLAEAVPGMLVVWLIGAEV